MNASVDRARRVAAWTALAFALTFGLLLALVSLDLTEDLDRRVAMFVAAHRTSWLTTVMRAVTLLGSTWVVVPVVLAAGLVALIRRRDSRPLVSLGASLGASVAVYQTLKWVVGRPRPGAELALPGVFHGLAFPSGHAAAAVAVWGMAAVLAWVRRVPGRRSWAAVAAVVVLAVGASRVYLGAHWLSDVLGGYALGAAAVSGLTMAGAPFTRP